MIDHIGDQKIDIIVSVDGTDPFFRLAVETCRFADWQGIAEH
jgi:hypothetical protein